MLLPDVKSPLAEELAGIIRASGPVSLATFIGRANAAYYDSRDPLGQAGDFTTAPEISQMFGEFVGLALADVWMRRLPDGPCHYVELGPGRGTLAADVLRTLGRYQCQPTPHFVETSSALQAMQRKAVPQVEFHAEISSLPRDKPLLIVANEFFDALPVRQMVRTAEGWREQMVDLDEAGELVIVPGSIAMDSAIPPALRAAPTGSIVETSPYASGVMYELAGRLARQGGMMLVIDYGYDAPGVGDTVQAVRAHRKVPVLDHPGEQDLSAHVNFPELAAMAQVRDVRVHGPVPQGAWLKALGIDFRCQALAAAHPDRADALWSEHQRLTAPDQMGQLFKVMAVASGDWPVPEGFGEPA